MSVIDHATGVCVVPSYAAANCALAGGGECVTVNGEPSSEGWQIDPYFNGENPRGVSSCATSGRFLIRRPGPNGPQYDLYDEGATVSITWGFPIGVISAPTSVVIGGSVNGPWTCILSNPHFDEFNRFVMDFVFQRQEQSGGGGEDDPPIQQ